MHEMLNCVVALRPRCRAKLATRHRFFPTLRDRAEEMWFADWTELYEGLLGLRTQLFYRPT